MAYRKVYCRIRTSGYSSGWSSDADRAASKKENRRLFQELGWAATLGCNGGCATVTKGQQDPYLRPSSFSGVIDKANIGALRCVYHSKEMTGQQNEYSNLLSVEQAMMAARE